MGLKGGLHGAAQLHGALLGVSGFLPASKVGPGQGGMLHGQKGSSLPLNGAWSHLPEASPD